MWLLLPSLVIFGTIFTRALLYSLPCCCRVSDLKSSIKHPGYKSRIAGTLLAGHLYESLEALVTTIQITLCLFSPHMVEDFPGISNLWFSEPANKSRLGDILNDTLAVTFGAIYLVHCKIGPYMWTYPTAFQKIYAIVWCAFLIYLQTMSQVQCIADSSRPLFNFDVYIEWKPKILPIGFWIYCIFELFWLELMRSDVNRISP